MSQAALQDNLTCDVLVIGSGAGGLAAAITANKAGLEVVVIEKEPVFGGTTAFSGGVLWIPGNPHCKTLPSYNAAKDTLAAARAYMQDQTGAFFDAASVDAFLHTGPEMVEFFERETSVQFGPALYPDYHPDAPGGVDLGRSILAAPFDIRLLGREMARLRPPLETITFIGMMFNSANTDLKHFFRVTKSFASFRYVAMRLVKHVIELARYGRGVQVTSGNALAARLAKSVFDLGIPLHTNAPAHELLRAGGGAGGGNPGSDANRITGARVGTAQGDVRITARRAVVLACGGFPHDKERLKQAYPHVARGGQHFSPTPESNSGDGIRLAEAAGGNMPIRLPQAAAWIPVSRVPLPGGRTGVFPHLLDRYKPGIIGVLRNGRRFTNESNSYHDVGADLIRACAGEKETAMWLVCDQAAIGKYGLGYAKPAPMRLAKFVKNGYLVRGNTLAELAQRAGIDAAALEHTVRAYNTDAARGEDPAFGRGGTSFNRYLADAENQPNPCVAPIGQGPYYALKLYLGDLGTFDGLTTNTVGQVLNAGGAVIDGLYAVGNDRASVMGGNYPGAGITLGPNMVFGYITARHIAGLPVWNHAAGAASVCAASAAAAAAAHANSASSSPSTPPSTPPSPPSPPPSPSPEELRHAA